MDKISKKTLIRVLSDTQVHELPQSTLSDKEIETSPAFRKKMKSIFRKNRRRYVRKRIAKVCAMFILALLVSGTLLLSFSSTARAELARWVKEKVGSDTLYRFLANAEGDYQLPQYEAGWLPEGVELVDTYSNEDTFHLMFANKDESIIILFDIYKVQTGSHVQLIHMEGYSHETIRLDGKTIDEYHLGERDRTLCWFEDGGKAMVMIDCFLTREEALRFISHLKRID